MDEACRTPLRFFKAATEGESSADEFGILEGRSMHRYGSLPADQPYHPDSGRLVCRSRSGPLRAGTPPSHHDRGVGIPSVLALIGARDAVLGLRRIRGQNTCACVVVGPLAVSLSPQQPFSSSPIYDRGETPGADHAMEKKEVLDGRCIVSIGSQSHSAARQRTGSRLSHGTDPQRRGIQRGRTDPSYRDSCYRRSSSPTARTKGSFTTGQACRGISCADQIGFACDEFQRQIA